MDIATLVQGLSALGWEVEQSDRERWSVRIAIPGDRRHGVTLAAGSDPDCQPLLFVWSEIGDAADLGDPWRLLELNAGLEYGALAVHEGALFLRESLRLDDLDPGIAARVLYHVAVAADELERFAYGDEADWL
jgi:hypothetical protein